MYYLAHLEFLEYRELLKNQIEIYYIIINKQYTVFLIITRYFFLFLSLLGLYKYW